MALLADVQTLLVKLQRSDSSDDGDNALRAPRSQERLSQELERVKQALLRKFEATHDPRWLVVRCHVVEQFVARLVVFTAPSVSLSADDHARKFKCVFLLENVITSSLNVLKRMSQHATRGDDDNNDDSTASAMEVDAGFGSEHYNQSRGPAAESKSLLLTSYRRVFESALPGSGSRSTAAAILSHLGELLAICWLIVDRHALLPKVIELLAISADCCGKYRDAQPSAKGPLFLLGMLQLVEKRDYEQALHYFRTVAMAQQQSAATTTVSDGVFHYWYGATLVKNGYVREATDQLQWCLRCNYEPVASLNLSALAHLRGTSNSSGDFHAASLDLQRALEIDFLESVTMFNYAALLGAMRNSAAQQQMLEYYQEAMHPDGNVAIERKRARSGTPKSERDREAIRRRSDGLSAAAAGILLFAEPQLAALFGPNGSEVTQAMVSSQLAYAAMENRDWQQSKQSFEELLVTESTADAQSEAYRDYIYVLLQSNLYSLALEKCDHVIAATRDNFDRTTDASLLIHLYRADALLSLERVDECKQFLKQVVEPKILQLLPSSPPQQHSQQQQQQQRSKRNKLQVTTSNSCSSEVVACHTQLINNLAVVTACQDNSGGVDTAISMLRDGIQVYPHTLSLTFNLVLLLWRKEQREAACSIWFEARGWNFHMDTRDLGDDKKAIEMVTHAEEAAILAAASPHPQVSEHVRSGGDTEEQEDGGDGISRQQLLYLDALILNHWGKIQSSRVIQSSVNYIQYLDSLTTTATRNAAKNRTSRMRTATRALIASVLSLSLAVTFTFVASYEQYRSRLPNGLSVPNARAVGHNLADGGGGKNVFGYDFMGIGSHEWNLALCQADSDGDGQTNGQELGDPCCTWSQADYPRPQRVTGISHPGDPDIKADPALWADLNCSEYRILVKKAISAAPAPSSSKYGSMLLVGAIVGFQTTFLL